MEKQTVMENKIYNLTRQQLEAAPYDFDLTLFSDEGIQVMQEFAAYQLEEVYGMTAVKTALDEAMAYLALGEVYDSMLADIIKREGLEVTA